jgi:hypothetical protein
MDVLGIGDEIRGDAGLITPGCSQGLLASFLHYHTG